MTNLANIGYHPTLTKTWELFEFKLCKAARKFIGLGSGDSFEEYYAREFNNFCNSSLNCLLPDFSEHIRRLNNEELV
tara:strand:- start:3339 stop:3569 length:231 start_codon:yes stop_codon:yes gene_type:complete